MILRQNCEEPIVEATTGQIPTVPLILSSLPQCLLISFPLYSSTGEHAESHRDEHLRKLLPEVLTPHTHTHTCAQHVVREIRSETLSSIDAQLRFCASDGKRWKFDDNPISRNWAYSPFPLYDIYSSPTLEFIQTQCLLVNGDVAPCPDLLFLFLTCGRCSIIRLHSLHFAAASLHLLFHTISQYRILQQWIFVWQSFK